MESVGGREVEKKKIKIEVSAFLIIGLIFSLIGVIFLPLGIFIYMNMPKGAEGAFIFLATFGGVGLVFLIVGLSFLIMVVNKKKREEKLLNAGHYVMAEAFEVDRNYNVRVNRVYPYIIKCRYQDNYGNIHIFKSKNLFFNPDRLLTDTMVKVYVDGENFKHYYMDIDEVLPKVYEH